MEETAFKEISSKYGLVGIVIMLAIMVVIRVGEYLMKVKDRRDAVTEKSLQQLTAAVTRLEHTMSEIPKIKTDVRRFYAAVKIISGENWQKVRDEILKEDMMS